MGTSSEPDPGGVVLSTRKALALIVVGTVLPYLAVYLRYTLDHSYTYTLVFWSGCLLVLVHTMAMI